ncbi:MAG: hypothetical protein ACREV9_12645 [Burkholderiales bacterium]
MSEHENVACPFCGLGCDDLRIAIAQDKVEVKANGCPISTPAFEKSAIAGKPKIDGKPVSLAEAISAAARKLASARRPVFGGMGADVAGMRAVLQLAERLGGGIEPANSRGMLRNILTLQDEGIASTTLSEVKNRADLIVIAGADVARRFPRFFERCLGEGLFASRREFVYIGKPVESFPAGAEVIACPNEKLGEIAAVLRALVKGTSLTAERAGGVAIEKLATLAKRMKGARYGVLIWTAADFDFSHAELTVQMLVQLVKDLNRETRFSALPLGGGNGDLTAAQVATWQSGYPLRIDFGSGYPRYDPFQVQSEDADVYVWVSSFFTEPPTPAAPTIALARPGTTVAAHVYIPVGMPGLDHAGHVFRTDNVVAIRLRKLRESSLPSVAEVISAIEKEV